MTFIADTSVIYMYLEKITGVYDTETLRATRDDTYVIYLKAKACILFLKLLINTG
jgi:hypothetical protein